MTDTDPFEAFVRRYQDMVYATAVRLLRTPVEAEDVAQIVFLRAFQRFDQIGASPAAAGWLKTVTRNACLNHLSRYRSRWRFFSELGRSDDRDSRATDELALVATPSPAVDVEVEDRRDYVTRALAGQIASAVALMLIVVASAILIASAQTAVYEMAARLLSGVTPVAQRAEAALNAARVVWRVLIEPLTVYAFVWVVLMCLACAAF